MGHSSRKRGLYSLASFLFLEVIMPSGIYKRTDYHKRKIREADNSGRFAKGHKKYTTKGDFQKGHKTWIKGLHPEYLQGKNHPMWKGGKTIDKSGYVLVKNRSHPFCDPSGYVREHRLVVEKQIGRYLKIEEVTHHVNKIKTDNRPENLMLFINNSAHRRFEKGGKYFQMEIIFDGRKLCRN